MEEAATAAALSSPTATAVAAGLERSSSSPSAAHLYVMRVKPTWRGTENDVDLALSLGMQRIVHVWINETWPGEISARPMDMIALQAQ